MTAAEDTAPRLRFLDDALVVADKPAGLLCVPGRGPDRADCLAGQVQVRWPDALVVHRLDMATSGLVVFARGKQAQRRLSLAFAAREVDKRYVALVEGSVAENDGDGAAGGWRDIALPLAADWPNRPRQMVDAIGGRPALTRWRVVARDPALRRTRVELEPLTGRSHQLRVHLASIGHPIVGDPLYAPADVAAAAPRLLLHATRLGFAHPLDGRPYRFESAAPF